MFYRCENGFVKGFADWKFYDGCKELVNVPSDYYNNNQDLYEVVNDELVERKDKDEIIKKKKEEEILSLTCTKRVLALALQEKGISYSQLKELIASNDRAQLEWDLCVELERRNPLLDIMGKELGLTKEEIDNIFILANKVGE